MNRNTTCTGVGREVWAVVWCSGGLKLPRWCFLTISWAADLSSLLLHRLSLTAVTHTSTFRKNMLQSRISIGVTYALNWQRNFFHLLTNFLIAYTLCNPYYLFFIFAQRLLVSSIRLKSFVLQNIWHSFSLLWIQEAFLM